jgi:hypothetical protein
VTALRIIEREERSDEDCAYKQRQTGFLPPGRPKGWRDKCMDRLRATIADKIEGNQLETRDKNKMWLVSGYFCPIQCCGSGMFIPDPGSKHSNKREWSTKFVVLPFFCSHKYHKIEN